MLCSFALCVVGCFILYKLIDYLIRIPRIGNYKNRYILVTGCDTGFGNLTVKRLDQLGCHVFAGCLTEKGETDLKKVCSDRLHTISLDVSSKESVRKALEYVKKKLPQGRGLWGLLNNAGVMLSTGPADWLTVDDFKKQCDVNLWGLIDVTLTFLPLVKKGNGRLVNTSSALGRIGLCFPDYVPYCMSKSGVETFTDGIRRTIYHFGCKASLIEPGGFSTSITDVATIHMRCLESWKRTSSEIKVEYGEEYFKAMITPRPGSGKKGSLGVSSRLTDVVDAYEHALLGCYPRARYLVGIDAKYIFAPLQAMPEWLSDWTIRKFYAARPLPAAALKR